MKWREKTSALCTVLVLTASTLSCGSGATDVSADRSSTSARIEIQGEALAGRTGGLAVTDASGRLARVQRGDISPEDAALGRGQVFIDGIETEAGDWHVVHTDCVEDGGTACSPLSLAVVDRDGDLVSQTEIAEGGRHAAVMVSDENPLVVLQSDEDFVLLQLDPEAGTRELWRSSAFDMTRIRQEANETGDFDVSLPWLRACAAGGRVVGVYRGPSTGRLEVLRLAGADDVRSEVPSGFETSFFEVVCTPDEPVLVGILENEVRSFGLVSGTSNVVSTTSDTAAGPTQRTLSRYELSFVESVNEIDIEAASASSPTDPLPLTLTRHYLDTPGSEETIFDGTSEGAPIVTDGAGLIAWNDAGHLVLEEQ